MPDPICIGVDIGGTSVKAAAVSPSGVLWKRQSRFYHRAEISDLRAAMADVSADAANYAPPECIGLCVPGIWDQTGRRIALAVNVPGLVGADLDSLIHDFFGQPRQPVKFVNDAFAAARDIVYAQHLKGRTLVLALGTGVGAAVLDDGVPLFVEAETPGHIGQLDVSIEGCDVIAPDGSTGGLEGYIGVAALQAAYGDDLTTALANFKGNEPALRALARAIRICHAIYRPEHIVLCGGIGVRLAPALHYLDALVRDRLTCVARAHWTLRAAAHEFHAALGAAAIAAEG